MTLRGVIGALAVATMLVAGSSAWAGEAPAKILVMLRLPPAHVHPNSDYGGDYGDGATRQALHRQAAALARRHGLMLADDWPMPVIGIDCFVMDLPAGRSPADAVAELTHEPGVSWSQPLNLYRGQAARHNDPLYPLQPVAKEWGLADLHRTATGAGVKVAVIDSRVETRHPDLNGQVAVSRNFVADRSTSAEFHGTAVAGVIAAIADNGIGIAGIAPGAQLLALRACRQLPGPATPPQTECDSLSLARAIDFAIGRGAGVINLSLAGPPDVLLGKLLDVALSRGATVVGAYDRGMARGGFPASHPGVVAVADESWAGIPPGVYRAPGRDVPTTTPGGHWSIVDGSSFAAAHVSGLIALARQHRSAGVRLAAWDGRIDACATLKRAGQSIDCGRVGLSQAATAAPR
ncbi:MAG TPA: S8 family serine peptidase [Caulobacteraceae bacterium]|jgi:subtilisin family serine protease